MRKKAGTSRSAKAPREPERAPLACPVCAQRMAFVRHGKTIVDACESHGVWLDLGELEAITRRITRDQQWRTATSVRRAVAQAERSGKASGWLRGPLAFLFD